jgi:phosphoribosylformylglycinamidine cyclo-ligase
LTATSRLPELSGSIGEVLLTPTRIYAKQILALVRDCPVKGIAHITGGGITENLPRVFPPGVRARIRRNRWPVPPIFLAISRLGSVEREEMYRVFNMGIGLILVVPSHAAGAVVQRAALMGDHGYQIGEMVAARDGEPRVEYVD